MPSQRLKGLANGKLGYPCKVKFGGFEGWQTAEAIDVA